MPVNQRTLQGLAAAIIALILAALALFAVSCRYTTTLEPIQGSVTVTTRPA